MRKWILIISTLFLFGMGGGNGNSCNSSGPSELGGGSCPFQFNSTGCHGNNGSQVQIVNKTGRSGWFDLYVNELSCKHPASPFFMGSNVRGVVLARFPLLSSANLRIARQGQSPTRVWKNIDLSTCAVKTLNLNVYP